MARKAFFGMGRCLFFSTLICVVFLAVSIGTTLPGAETSPCGNILFQIGRPDAMSAEFRHGIKWESVKDVQGPVHRFVVGKNRVREWIPMHYSTREFKAAGYSFTVQIEFQADKKHEEPLYFIVGASFGHPTEPSLINVLVNGQAAEPKRQPKGPGGFKFDSRTGVGFFQPTIIELPQGSVVQGTNKLDITLTDGSWIFYDYLVLCDKPVPPKQLPPPDLKKEFRTDAMKDVKEILFVVRKPGIDPHWYANFGYYAESVEKTPFPLGGGSWLSVLNIETDKVRTVFKDKEGTIRDPQLHYNGEKIIFSYLPAGKRHFNLYEINTDGTGLKQITSGDWDDIEPTYTAGGDIIFCSSRSKRWVQCWLTPVATLHCCGPNGENIRELSANVEHDNTPWPLPNGQILYTRWEYVDRSQVHYHHLWTMNPDGTRQMVYFGNLVPGVVMIDAKPIRGSKKIVSSFSPGHGRREHYGKLTLVDPTLGPDDPNGAIAITNHSEHADPWAFSENAFMAARKSCIELIDVDGREQTLFELPEKLKEEGFWIHEPRPVSKSVPEISLAAQTDPSDGMGRLALVNIYEGRKMEGVKPGSIKELLVLETLPEPIHYSGGMDQISLGGTFTLERIVGTIPVEPDGSAFMELPALRSFLFVAMDHDGRPVKRMHSFTCVMPGETTTCIGCHEQRTQAPFLPTLPVMKVLSRIPHRPAPIKDIPQVFDFPRDIQPILEKHCVRCHDNNKADGGINLSGHWGPQFMNSYMALAHFKTFGDNRNRAESNFGPYEIGSSASKLVKLVEEGHAETKLSDHEKKMIRYWIDVGANYAGTYAANGAGQIGWHYQNQLVRNDSDWPEIKEFAKVLGKRCDHCHSNEKKLYLPHAISQNTSRFSRHSMFNLSEPAKSRFLLGPLAKEAGGRQRCGEVVFKNTKDPDYRILLAAIERGRNYVTKESPRFCMKPFYANEPYTREMIRFGILPKNHDRTKTPIDPYETDRKYWESLWYKPVGEGNIAVNP